MITDIFTYLFIISISVLLIFSIRLLREKNPQNIYTYKSVLLKTIFNLVLVGICFGVYRWNQSTVDHQLLQVTQQLRDLHINLEFTNNEFVMYSMVILSVFFITFRTRT